MQGQGTITSFFFGQSGQISSVLGSAKLQKKAKAHAKLNEKKKCRDVHVCLKCVNDPTLNDKKTAILCRGNLHQIKCHYQRHNWKKGEECEMTSKKDFTDIVVPLNHVSVPNKIRRLAMTNVKKGTENGNNGDKTRVESSKLQNDSNSNHNALLSGFSKEMKECYEKMND